MLALYETDTQETGLWLIDTRAKMAISIIASISTIVISNLFGQILLCISSLVYTAFLKRINLILGAYVLVSFLFALAIGCTEIMRHILPFMRDIHLETLIVPFLRMLTMVHVLLPLAFASRIQHVLDALRGLRLPFYLYLPTAVMIRFIPSFLHDVKQIKETLHLRGFPLNIRNVTLHPIRLLRFVGAPLLFRSLRTSEDLGISAELKGLGAGAMTAYRAGHWGSKETALVSVGLAISLTALACQIFLGVGKGVMH